MYNLFHWLSTLTLTFGKPAMQSYMDLHPSMQAKAMYVYIYMGLEVLSWELSCEE